MTKNSAGVGKRKSYARYFAHYTKKNNVLILLGILFVAGVALGTVLLGGVDEETIAVLERVMGSFIARRQAAGLSEVFFSALGASMIFVGVLFVIGFCAIAQPVIIAAPLVRGVGFGFSAASLYARYGAHAAGFISVLILPGMLISTVAILICCKHALRLSGAFFFTMNPHGAKSPEPFFLRGYCLNFAFAIGICALSALAEAVLYLTFANSFAIG